MFTPLKRLAGKAGLLTTLISLLTFTVALAASGNLDTTFSGDGKVTVDFARRSDVATDIALQAGGKILAAGHSTVPSTGNRDFALARFDPNGSIDTTFSGDGKLITNFGGRDEIWDIAVQSNGIIIAAGLTCDNAGNNCDVALARYKPGGALDITFSGDGKQVTDFGGGSNSATGIVIQPNGKIVLAGWMWNGTSNDFAIYRYNADGTLDPTFSGDGKVNIGFGLGRQDSAEALAYQHTDGKIVVVGHTGDANYKNHNFAIARLNPNGTLDNTFSEDGKQVTNFGADDLAYGFAGLPDGRMVVVGQKVTTTGLGYFAVARYNADGNLDTTFNGAGKKTFSISPGSNSYAYSAIVQPGGKIVISGRTDGADGYDFALVRLNPNGSLDTTFSGDGKVAIGFCGGSEEEGFALLRQPLDGKYVLAGSTTCGIGGKDFAVARVLP